MRTKIIISSIPNEPIHAPTPIPSRYGIADLSDDDDDSAIQVDPVPAVGTASEGTEGAALFLTAPPRALLPPVEEDGPEISLVPSERSDPGAYTSVVCWPRGLEG